MKREGRHERRRRKFRRHREVPTVAAPAPHHPPDHPEGYNLRRLIRALDAVGVPGRPYGAWGVQAIHPATGRWATIVLRYDPADRLGWYWQRRTGAEFIALVDEVQTVAAQVRRALATPPYDRPVWPKR